MGNWATVGGYHSGNAPFNANVYKASEADNLCLPPNLAPKHSNPTFWRSPFLFSIIMFVPLVVDNVVTLVVVTLVGVKIVTLVVDSKKSKS